MNYRLLENLKKINPFIYDLVRETLMGEARKSIVYDPPKIIDMYKIKVKFNSNNEAITSYSTKKLADGLTKFFQNDNIKSITIERNE